jgi:hypothetical protein
VLVIVVSFIVLFLYCVCALFVCNLCHLSVVLLYYCHRVKALLQFNKYIYILKYLATAFQQHILLITEGDGKMIVAKI